MICRQCGVQFDGAVCPVCGAKNEEALWNPAKSMAEVTGGTSPDPEAHRAPPAGNAGGVADSPPGDYFVPETASADAVGGDDDPFLPDPITPAPTGNEPAEGDEKISKQAKKREMRRREERKAIADGAGKYQPPERRALILPAIGFLLPLAYLFFDLFVFFGRVLEGNGLSEFLDLATSPMYNANTAGELVGAAFGTESPLTLLSLRGMALPAFRLPVLMTLICVVLCALTGVLLLCSGTRLLRSRAFADIAVLTGLLGTFAPFAGKLAYLLNACLGGGAALHSASAELMPSFEALLLMVVCCAFLLPSLATLKRLSARAHGKKRYIPLLCDSVGKGFPLAKTFTAVFLALCVGVACLFFTGRVYLPDYHFSAWRARDLLTKTGELLRTAISGAEEGNQALLVLSLIADLFFLISLPALIIALAALLVRFFTTVFTGRTVFAKKRSRSRVNEGKITAATARRTLLLPFWFALSYRVLATAILASFMGVHLDFANPGETLTLMYLAVAGAGSLFSVSGAYALLVSAGSVFWHLAGGFHNVMSARRLPAGGEGEL